MKNGRLAPFRRRFKCVSNLPFLRLFFGLNILTLFWIVTLSPNRTQHEMTFLSCFRAFYGSGCTVLISNDNYVLELRHNYFTNATVNGDLGIGFGGARDSQFIHKAGKKPK